MLEMEEETKYGPRGEAIVDGLLLATTLLCLMKVGMENNFGYCFVTNQSIWR
jgi:hypothetical protein